MAAGDAVYFHSNTLHSSDPNTSDRPRWGMICCYNTRHNDPYKESHHPRYTPLVKVPDTAIKEVGNRQVDTAREFLDPQQDRTTGSGKK
jgi:ectoine hydroxylase